MVNGTVKGAGFVAPDAGLLAALMVALLLSHLVATKLDTRHLLNGGSMLMVTAMSLRVSFNSPWLLGPDATFNVADPAGPMGPVTERAVPLVTPGLILVFPGLSGPRTFQ